MKLLNYTSIRYLLFTALLLLISIPISYVALNRVFIEAIDRDLYQQADQIPLHQNHIQSPRDLALWKILDNDLEIFPADSIQFKAAPFTIRRGMAGKRDQQDFRMLQKKVSMLGKEYIIQIKSSLIEKEDLVKTILTIQLSLFFLMLLGAAIINHFINKKVWKPFYSNLAFLKNFNLEHDIVSQPAESTIQEFRQLNHSVHQLATSVRNAYLSQKEFTENASHELQTPLAILKSKLELLLQEKELTQEQSMLIDDMYKVIGQMESLNSSLLLLSRMENNQFTFQEQLIPGDIVAGAAEELQFMTEAKHHTLEMNKPEDFLIPGNKSLFRILVINLLRNAIQHTEPGSVIRILFDRKSIIFTNPGNPLDMEEDKLFNRFTKSGNRKGNGLGLAIARKIAELHHADIGYSYKEGQHMFYLYW